MAKILTPATQGAQQIGNVKPIAADTPFQSLQTDADMFGAAQGKALQQAAGQAQSAIGNALDAKIDHDKNKSRLRSLEIDAEIASFEETQDEWRKDQKMADAENMTGLQRDNYKAFFDSIDTTGLTDEDLALYNLKSLRQTNNAVQDASKRETTELNKYEEQLTAARIGTGQKSMARNYDDPDVMSDNVAKITSSRIALSKKQGLDPSNKDDMEIIQSQIDKDVSSGTKMAIERALAEKNVSRAEELLMEAKEKGHIVGDDRTSAESIVESEVQKRDDQKKSNEIWAVYGEDSTGAHKFIRNTYEGDELDRQLTRYNQRLSERKAEEAIEHDALFDKAVLLARDGRLGELTPAEQNQLKEKGGWDAVGSMHVAATTNTAEQTDYVWMSENYYSKSTIDRHKIPLHELKPHLSFDDYSKVKAERIKAETPVVHQKTNDYIKQSLDGIDIKMSDRFKDEDTANQVAYFYQEFESRVSIIMSRDGQVTEAQKREIIDDITREVVVERSGFDIEDPIVKWEQTDWEKARAEFGMSDVNSTESMVRILQMNDVPVTTSVIKDIKRINGSEVGRGKNPEQIFEIWKLGQNGGSK